MTVWDRLVGQQHVVGELAAAARGEQLTPSWLFTGPAGSGRSVAARVFAAALECATRSGCGSCEACREVLAGTHPDVTVFQPDELSIGIAAARELVREAATSPTVGRYRVLVIEDADRLTPEAENVLLKPLEEPPERTIMLLCAPAEDDLLPTTRSRCRVMRLRTPHARDLIAALEAAGVDSPMAAFAARAALGHLGRARRLATDEAARQRRLDVLRLTERLANLPDALAAAADLAEAAEEESDAANQSRNADELATLQATLSASAGGGRGRGRGQLKVRGAAGAVKELERRQELRGKRSRLDMLDRSLVDLAAWYRDVLAVQTGALDQPVPASEPGTDAARVEAVHDDQRAAVAREARRTRPEQTVRRISAILDCRRALLETPGLSSQLALEALAAALRDEVVAGHGSNR